MNCLIVITIIYQTVLQLLLPVECSELVLVPQNADTSTETIKVTDVTNTKIFKATNEWKEVNDEILPRGLHVRINLETGKKEAKLLESNDEKDSNSQITSNYQVAHKVSKNSPNLLSQNSFLKKLDDLKREAKESNKNIKKTSKTIQEIRSNFGQSNVKFQSETELLKNLLDFYREENDVARKMSLLADIEYYAHNVDLAKDFHTYGGFDVIIGDLNTTNHHQFKIELLTVLGSALQGNLYVKEKLLKTALLRTICVMINHDISDLMLTKKYLFVLSTFIRNYLPAQEEFFVNLYGMNTLESLLNQNLLVSLKSATLLSDIVTETIELKPTGFDFPAILRQSNVCLKTMDLFHQDLDLSSITSLLESMHGLLPVCTSSFRPKISLLEPARLKFANDDYVTERFDLVLESLRGKDEL